MMSQRTLARIRAELAKNDEQKNTNPREPGAAPVRKTSDENIIAASPTHSAAENAGVASAQPAPRDRVE